MHNDAFGKGTNFFITTLKCVLKISVKKCYSLINQEKQIQRLFKTLNIFIAKNTNTCTLTRRTQYIYFVIFVKKYYFYYLKTKLIIKVSSKI